MLHSSTDRKAQGENGHWLTFGAHGTPALTGLTGAGYCAQKAWSIVTAGMTRSS